MLGYFFACQSGSRWLNLSIFDQQDEKNSYNEDAFVDKPLHAERIWQWLIFFFFFFFF